MEVGKSEVDLMKVFVFRDEKSSAYGMPVTSRNRGTFLRETQDRMMEGQSMLARHPMDFSIYEIGEYCPEEGSFFPHENKHCMGLVSDLIPSKQ